MKIIIEYGIIESEKDKDSPKNQKGKIMKTYRIYIRNAMTKYRWYFAGTTRANNETEVQKEIFEMNYRNPDSEYKFEIQKEENK